MTIRPNYYYEVRLLYRFLKELIEAYKVAVLSIIEYLIVIKTCGLLF
jgi:hypothetical protein